MMVEKLETIILWCGGKYTKGFQEDIPDNANLFNHEYRNSLLKIVNRGTLLLCMIKIEYYRTRNYKQKIGTL